MARKKNHQLKKVIIFDALHKCLQEKPFDQTSIKEIAKTAGVNHGLLHYYFESKEDILLCYIEHILSIYKSDFAEWLQSRTSGPVDKSQLIQEIFNYVNRKITLNKELSIVFIELWSIALYNPKVKSKLQQTYEAWIYTLTDILKSVSGKKEDVNLTSTAIVAFLEGMALFSVILDPVKFNFSQVLKSFQRKIIENIKS